METPGTTDPLEDNAQAAARLLKVLANEKRLLALCRLKEGEKSVSQLLDLIDISQSALSQHLATLRQHRIVKTRRDGAKILYSLADQNVEHLLRVLCQIFKP